MPGQKQHTSTVQGLFDQKASTWSNRYSSALRTRLEAFSRALKKHGNPDQPLLDYGCGSGVLSQKALELGYNVSCIDLSFSMLEQTRFMFVQNQSNHKLICGLDSCLKDKQYFGTILCSSVVEYMTHPKQFMQHCSNLLAKDGTLIVSVPNKLSAVRAFESIAKPGAFLTKHVPLPAKIRSYQTYLTISKNRYSCRDLQKLADHSGLKLVELSFLGDHARAIPAMHGIGIRFPMILAVMKKTH